MTAESTKSTISHARTAPLRNVFRYRSYLWLVDVDHLPRRPAGWPASAAATTSATRGASIRDNLDRFLAARGIDLGGGRVTMLAQARVLGYVFNPLTVYWCHRPDGARCVVAEVHNTYGQRHAYLLRPDDRGRAGVPKQFYVSPVLPRRRRLPDEPARAGATLALSVRLDRPDGHSFAASVRGRAVPATARARLQTAASGIRGPRPRSAHGSAGRACGCTCAGCR